MQTRLLKTKTNKAYELTIMAESWAAGEKLLKKIGKALPKNESDIHEEFIALFNPFNNTVEIYFYGKDKELKNFKKFLVKHVN